MARYFLVFFLAILAVNAVMVTLAFHTHTGLVTEHPYEKGLRYNQVVEAEERQATLGWKADMGYKNGVLHFDLRDKNGQPILPAKATATLIRPTQQGMDFVVGLEGAATPVTFPAKGLWEVRVDAVHGGVHYQQSQRVVVK